jgi:itaconate CoA-transferase
MTSPLDGLLVVSVEQAVAAPMCSCRLADAGARVIKIERPEGDFARGYDSLVHGESAYFVWLNRGKESVILDLTLDADKALLEAMLARADVFIQNLKPGALARLGFGRQRLARRHPALIQCSISGFGESGIYASRKAYDLLIQAESGLASLTGTPESPGRVGVSVVDIATGLNAYAAILEALMLRARSGEGSLISVSMFDAMADWLTVPLLQHEGGRSPQRMGLAHPSISPYGVFETKNKAAVLIAIQNDREWRVLASQVLRDETLARDERFATNVDRVAKRDQTDGLIAAFFVECDTADLIDRLAGADIAFALLNDMDGLGKHPHLRRIDVTTPTGPVSYPAPAALREGERWRFGAVPALGQHTELAREEFGTRAPD